MNQLRDTFQRDPDGEAKRRFTAGEFERMGMAGIFAPDERVELIAGEIYRMSPVGPLHTVLRAYLAHSWSRRASDQALVISEAPLRLSEDFEPVADLVVLPFGTLPKDFNGKVALLVVEIADSSLAMDTGVKAAAYAAGGVREYWVINARTRETIVHTAPGLEGYGVVTTVASGDLVTPREAPELAVRMSELPQA